MELVFRKEEFDSYKKFYERICIDLKLEEDKGLREYENLLYNADLLTEFMWGVQDENITCNFIGFDREAVKNKKTYNDYGWNLIFEVLEDFVEKWPNNRLIFE